LCWFKFHDFCPDTVITRTEPQKPQLRRCLCTYSAKHTFINGDVLRTWRNATSAANYTSSKGFLEECGKKEHVAVSATAAVSCMKRRLLNVLSTVTYSPTHRQAGAPTINIKSTLRTAPICVNMFHCSVIW